MAECAGKHLVLHFFLFRSTSVEKPHPRPRPPSGRAGGGATTLFVVDMWITCGKLTPVDVLHKNPDLLHRSYLALLFLLADFLPGGGFFRRFFLPVKIPVFAQKVAKNAHFWPEIGYFLGIRSVFCVFRSGKS